mmetsp:Transcript_105184/g.255341  ORF Transcript_105184/g.255341 Transcript_105184/m.255341 type:complete len:207 (-) Transcript_105184:176-796(-)
MRSAKKTASGSAFTSQSGPKTALLEISMSHALMKMSVFLNELVLSPAVKTPMGAGAAGFSQVMTCTWLPLGSLCPLPKFILQPLMTATLSHAKMPMRLLSWPLMVSTSAPLAQFMTEKQKSVGPSSPSLSGKPMPWSGGFSLSLRPSPARASTSSSWVSPLPPSPPTRRVRRVAPIASAETAASAREPMRKRRRPARGRLLWSPPP